MIVELKIDPERKISSIWINGGHHITIPDSEESLKLIYKYLEKLRGPEEAADMMRGIHREIQHQ